MHGWMKREVVNLFPNIIDSFTHGFSKDPLRL